MVTQQVAGGTYHGRAFTQSPTSAGCTAGILPSCPVLSRLQGRPNLSGYTPHTQAPRTSWVAWHRGWTHLQLTGAPLAAAPAAVAGAL